MDKSRAVLLDPVTRVNVWRVQGRFSFPHLGLSSRLLLIVIAVSLIGVLTSSLLLLSWHNTLLIEGAELSLTELAAPIQASLEHAMLTHDDTMMNEIMEAVAFEPGVQNIRILDGTGLVRKSSLPSEVGQHYVAATECQECHARKSSQGAITKTSTLVETPNSQFLLNVSPIENGSRCWGCHDVGAKTLGILMIQAPVKDLNTQIRESSWHIGLAALFTFVLLVGLMVPILRRSITNPVAELSRGVAEIGSENLDYQVRVSSHDEIGNLATGLEAMRKQLKLSPAEMEQRNRELAVLHQVALMTGQLLEIDKILAQVLDIVIDKLGLHAGIIYLWDKSKDRFERRVSRGHSETRLREIEERRQMPDGDLTQRVAKSGNESHADDRHTIYQGKETAARTTLPAQCAQANPNRWARVSAHGIGSGSRCRSKNRKSEMHGMRRVRSRLPDRSAPVRRPGSRIPVDIFCGSVHGLRGMFGRLQTRRACTRRHANSQSVHRIRACRFALRRATNLRQVRRQVCRRAYHEALPYLRFSTAESVRRHQARRHAAA